MEKDKSVRFKLPLDSVLVQTLSASNKKYWSGYILQQTITQCLDVTLRSVHKLKKRQFHVFKYLYSNGKCLI